MSCVFKIKEASASLTATEQKIADYILENRDETIHASAQTLAESIQTSAAALIRFSQKLGYKGFTALKVDLAADNSEENSNFDELIKEEDSIDTLLKKAQFTNLRTMNETYKLINTANMEKAIQIVRDAKTLYLFGVGGSGIVCNDLMHKLSRINRNVVYHEDPHILVARCAHITKDDAVLAISYSGETDSVNIGVKYAKEAGAKSIAITQFNAKSQLSKLADIVLHVPTEEKELRLGAIASRTASLILTDLLYLGSAKTNLEQTMADLRKTRALIQHIK